MAIVCREIVERIEETVWEPVEEWVERREKKCKKKKCKKWCLCCNKWFCWIETFFEKVVTWVAKTVVNFVTRTVCEIVSDVISAIIDTLVTLIKIIVDIGRILWNAITLDWDGLKDAWKDLVGHIVDLGPILLKWIKLGIAVGTFGLPYLSEYIREKINETRLKRYIRRKLDKTFGDDPERLQKIKDAIHLDHGPFGLQFDATSIRTFVDSRAASFEDTPTLLALHNAGTIDLYELSGVAVGNYLDRPRVEAHLIDGEVPLEREDIDEYIDSNGEGPHFRVYAFNRAAETEKLTVALDKGRTIGLKFQWRRDTLEVEGMDQMDIDRTQLSTFLSTVLNRSPNGDDVCSLVAAGVFNITNPSDGRHPFGWTKWYSPGNRISGVAHRDRLPADFLKYVLIHEMGHYFSLEHEGHDGLDKIMFSPVENDWWSWNLIVEFLWWSGEPQFTYDDGKQAWDFLIDTIPQCLPGGNSSDEEDDSGTIIT